MPTFNSNTNISNIQADIDALTKSSSAEDLLTLSLSTDVTTSDRIVAVNTVGDLPSLDGNFPNDFPSGQIIFVRSINTLVVAGKNGWYGTDGRLLRNDDTTPDGLIYKTTSTGVSPLCNNVYNDWKCVKTRYAGTPGVNMALRANGTLWAWGCNVCGVLGDGTAGFFCRGLTAVVGGFTDWCQFDLGAQYAAGVRTNGTLWTWGVNCYGGIGDNTLIQRTSPVSVVGGFTDWCQVSVGGGYGFSVGTTLAIRTNGTLWAWGYNSVGQVGDNTLANRSSPVSVVGGFTDWCQVSICTYSAAAIRTNGSLWTWGRNFNGELGDGTAICRSSPVSVIGGFTDWCQVSTGHNGMIGIRTNGTMWTWGTSPVSVVGGFTDWCQVSGPSSWITQYAAVRTNGTLWTWGYNNAGELGDGTITFQTSPVSVLGGFTDWCQASAGQSFIAALRACL